MTAIVRHLNGTSSDFLDTLGGSGTLNAISAGGWVKRDAMGTRVGLVGRANSANDQWSFYQFETDILVFQVTNGGVGKTSWSIPVDTSSSWVWVGFTRSWPAGVVNFYYGTSPGSLTLLTNQNVDVDIQIPNSGGLATQLGGISQGNLISIGWWNGYLDQWNLWQAELTQGELESSMSCGAVVRSADAIFIIPINGTSPEDVTALGGSGTMSVSGTTVVTGDGIGCESGVGTLVPPTLPPFPKSPNFSGGPGGGFQVPTLEFGDSEPMQISPLTSNARTVQTPDFGSMGIKGMKGRGKALQMGQRINSMYRGLDHLASVLTRRRK